MGLLEAKKMGPAEKEDLLIPTVKEEIFIEKNVPEEKMIAPVEEVYLIDDMYTKKVDEPEQKKINAEKDIGGVSLLNCSVNSKRKLSELAGKYYPISTMKENKILYSSIAPGVIIEHRPKTTPMRFIGVYDDNNQNYDDEIKFISINEPCTIYYKNIDYFNDEGSISGKYFTLDIKRNNR